METTKQKAAWRGQVRMPAPLADWIKARADGRYRSMNAEIVDLVLRAKEQASVPSSTHGSNAK